MRMRHYRPAVAALAAGILLAHSVPAFAGTDTAGGRTRPDGARVAPGPVRDAVDDALSRRLFPVLGGLGADPSRIEALRAAPGAAPVLAARQARLAACGTDLTCLAAAMIWTDAEIAAFAGAMPSSPAQGDDSAVAAVSRELQGVNTIVRTYGLGAAPGYPEIDGAGAIKPEERQVRLQAAAWLARTPRAGSLQVLDPSVDFALALLDGSDRTDAIGYEPLNGGLNAPAMARARATDWSRWHYSAMIVTGVGPEIDGMPLSPLGKYHVRLAAARFAKGDVPFIVLTGGRAHPRATRFAEAEQMRKALIERYGVPADAIVIEPYARHTTTNLRNAGRMLMLMGAPLVMDTLIVCNEGQSAYIESDTFTQRNAHELGYQPGKVTRRLSPTELVFVPSALSARVDPRDPLDP